MSSTSRIILAYCAQKDSCLVQCIDAVKHFYFEPDVAKVFNIVCDYHRKHGKTVTSKLLDKILDAQNIDPAEQQDLVDIFEEALDADVDQEEFEFYLDELKKEYTQRVWKEAWTGSVSEEGEITPGIEDLINKDPKKAYEVFKSSIAIHMEELENENLSNCASLAETADKFLADYKERVDNPEKAYGIRTGFDHIDQQTLGIHAGELFIIGGRTGAGKSVFILNVGVNAYKNGKNVLIVSIEMPHTLYQERFYSCYCDLPYNAIRAGTLSKEQYKILQETLMYIKNEEQNNKHYLHIADITSVSAFTVDAEVKKVTMKYGNKPDLLIIDYIGIMKSIDNSNADWQEQLAIAEEVRSISRTKKIPILSAVQLNRDKHKSKGTERIGRSDGIGATCDVYLQIEEKQTEDEDSPKKLSLDLDDTMGIYVGKCRNGETDRSFQLYKNFANMMLKNKEVYKSRADQAVESLNEINVDVSTPKDNLGHQVDQSVILGTEDQSLQQTGDFISRD